MATREIYAALGAEEAHTYSLSGGHQHCSLPSSQNHWVQSYVRKYLLGGEGEASAIETSGGYEFDRARWISEVPAEMALAWVLPSARTPLKRELEARP